jgi:hypothetical protein
MSAGKPSQQIWIENGRSPASMNPGGMSARNANATSMMLANSVRLRRSRALKRISHGIILGRGILPKPGVSNRSSAVTVMTALLR